MPEMEKELIQYFGTPKFEHSKKEPVMPAWDG
jgi:hypothetical protein